jgi:hypothetical protein
VGGRRSGGAPILLLVGARLAAGRHGARWCGGRARDGEETGAAGPIDFLSRMVPNISGRFYIRGWICSWLTSQTAAGTERLHLLRSAREPNAPLHN